MPSVNLAYDHLWLLPGNPLSDYPALWGMVIGLKSGFTEMRCGWGYVTINNFLKLVSQLFLFLFSVRISLIPLGQRDQTLNLTKQTNCVTKFFSYSDKKRAICNTS